MYWPAGMHRVKEPAACCSPCRYRRQGNTARFDSLVRLQGRLCQAPSRPQSSPRTMGKGESRGPKIYIRAGSLLDWMRAAPVVCCLSDLTRRPGKAFVLGGQCRWRFLIYHVDANWVQWGVSGASREKKIKIKKYRPVLGVSSPALELERGYLCATVENARVPCCTRFFPLLLVCASKVPGCSGLGLGLTMNGVDGSPSWDVEETGSSPPW